MSARTVCIHPYAMWTHDRPRGYHITTFCWRRSSQKREGGDMRAKTISYGIAALALATTGPSAAAQEWPSNLGLGIGAVIAAGAVLLSQQNAIVGGSTHIGADGTPTGQVVSESSPGSSGHATGTAGATAGNTAASGNSVAGRTSGHQIGPLSPGPPAGTGVASSSVDYFAAIDVCACDLILLPSPGTFTVVTTTGTGP